jgi:predicted nucleic acid-binding Zn ribbon protein
MNYKKHYDLLIERARTRQLTDYVEKHHIVPRCIGGTDKKSNLVELTPEEHYVAHQLLVKMYPENDSLVYAANKMTVSSKTVKRNNKRYGWLKRRYQSVCKKRIGKKNPSYRRNWYHDPRTLESGKFLLEDVPTGWIKGRKINKTIQYSLCECCNKKIKSKNKFCSKICRNKVNRKLKEEKSKNRAYESWNKFINGNFKSALEFFQSQNIYRTHQHMYRDWKKYVNEYTLLGPDGKGLDCKSKAL